MLRIFCKSLVGGALISWVVGIGPLCWILRDGLGPRSVDSHGLVAVVRFLFTFYWGPVLAGLSVLYLLCSVRGRLKESASSEQTPDQ